MRKCLVVDDSKVIRKVASHILETLDYSVVEAEDGCEALDYVQGNSLDVVLLDWNMPVMDGLEILLALRKSKLAAQPKVIFCTTENDVEQIRRAMDAGADEYIMKPFDRETLKCKLDLVEAGVDLGQST